MNLRTELEAGATTEPLQSNTRRGWWNRRKTLADQYLKLGQEHRESCSKLALARSLDLPDETINRWSHKVATQHAWLYKPHKYNVQSIFRLIFTDVPYQLAHDRAVWLSLALFYGLFIGMAFWSAAEPGRAEQFVGSAQLGHMEKMYAEPIGDSAQNTGEPSTIGRKRNDTVMTGFYIRNNAGIGLQCFGWGLAFGVGSLYILCSNALQLGIVFGHMARTPYWGNFSTFVTAHSSFELTAICLSAAAGFRMGYGLVETHGRSRLGSLRHEARASLPMIGTATMLFILAAFIEGYISASTISYELKLLVALATALLLLLFASLGLRQRGGIHEIA